MGGPDLLDFVLRLFQRGREGLEGAIATDVHEINLRIVIEKVIVQCRHAQSILQRDAHYRVYLVLKHDEIAHHHGFFLDAFPEGCPGREAHEGFQSPAIDSYWKICSRK